MSRCVAALRRCLLDSLLDAQHEEAWAALPQRIILIRHGQAEHNLEEGAVYATEGSNPRLRPQGGAGVGVGARVAAAQVCCYSHA